MNIGCKYLFPITTGLLQPDIYLVSGGMHCFLNEALFPSDYTQVIVNFRQLSIANI